MGMHSLVVFGTEISTSIVTDVRGNVQSGGRDRIATSDGQATWKVYATSYSRLNIA